MKGSNFRSPKNSFGSVRADTGKSPSGTPPRNANLVRENLLLMKSIARTMPVGGGAREFPPRKNAETGGSRVPTKLWGQVPSTSQKNGNQARMQSMAKGAAPSAARIKAQRPLCASKPGANLLQNSPKAQGGAARKNRTPENKIIFKGETKGDPEPKSRKANRISKRKIKNCEPEFSTLKFRAKRESQSAPEQRSEAGPLRPLPGESKTRLWKSPEPAKPAKRGNWSQKENRAFLGKRSFAEFPREMHSFGCGGAIGAEREKLMGKSNFGFDKTFLPRPRNFCGFKRKVSFLEYKRKFSLTGKMPVFGGESNFEADEAERAHFVRLSQTKQKLKLFLQKQLSLFKCVN